MLVVSCAEILALLPMPRLIEALRSAFGTGCVAPVRHMESIPGGQGSRVLFSMPAFDSHGSGVIKLVSVFPDNQTRGLPTVQAVIVVFSDKGAAQAILDGTAITQLRTAAASALASSYLSRPDSSALAVIGTGALAPYMAAAHCVMRPIRTIAVCGRREARAVACAEAIRSMVTGEIEVTVPRSIEEAVRSADIVSCATTSATPVVAGEWLRAGTFLDLVGSFSPERREADDAAVRRSRIFVDTFDGALLEGGDLVAPLANGVISRKQIEGEMADLVCGRVQGRSSSGEITLFKSVGAAIEDLAAAHLVLQMLQARRI